MACYRCGFPFTTRTDHVGPGEMFCPQCIVSSPIIFLDIDGVLVTNDFYKRFRRQHGRHASTWNKLDTYAVSRINKIIEATGAVVVVSSTWRTKAMRDGEPGAETITTRLWRILRENGFKGVVVGITPYRGGELRGMEIQAWIDAYDFKGPFVIIDDGADMAHLIPYLVQTRFAVGVTEENVKQAIDVIQRSSRMLEVG